MRSIALLIIVLFLAAPGLLAATITGKVVRVADGDTVTVMADGQRHRVRLAAIDAPEQRYGKASGAALRDLTLNRTVRVEYEKRDRYGRIVGTVWAAHPDCRRDCALNLDAGLLLVPAGLAWHFKRYAHEQAPDERERYAEAEIQARACGRTATLCRRGTGGAWMGAGRTRPICSILASGVMVPPVAEHQLLAESQASLRQGAMSSGSRAEPSTNRLLPEWRRSRVMPHHPLCVQRPRVRLDYHRQPLDAFNRRCQGLPLPRSRQAVPV